MYVMETTSGGTFVDGKCTNKKRVGGKTTAKPNAPPHHHSLVIHSLPIYIWGGWATGHEAVQLTDRLVLGVDPTEGSLAVGEAISKFQQQQQPNQQHKEEIKPIVAKEPDPSPNIEAAEVSKGEETLDAHVKKNDAESASHDEGSSSDTEEEAEMHERSDVADELADDDKANLGDLSHQLQHGLNSKVANPADVMKDKIAKLKHHTTDKIMERLNERLHHSRDKMKLMKDQNPGAILDNEDKKMQYLEKMKKHMDPERYQLMKDRMEQHFDRREKHRTTTTNARRHNKVIRPLHELKELGDQVEAGLEEDAKQRLPQDVRQRLDAFHLHDKRWADRLHKKQHPDKANEVASERTDDDYDPASSGRGLGALLTMYSGHDHELDWKQFLYACVFFVVTNVLVIQLCLCVGGQKDKGRTQ
jgi:hypothetical protein